MILVVVVVVVAVAVAAAAAAAAAAAVVIFTKYIGHGIVFTHVCWFVRLFASSDK